MGWSFDLSDQRLGLWFLSFSCLFGFLLVSHDYAKSLRNEMRWGKVKRKKERKDGLWVVDWSRMGINGTRHNALIFLFYF